MTSPPTPGVPPPGPHLRGLVFLARFEYLRREHGPGMVEAVMQALDEPDRGALRGVDRREWYPFGTLVRLDRTIARLTAPDDDSIYERIGRASARHRTEWLGPDARFHNIHGFLSRLADQHPRLHSFGDAVYHRRGFREGVIEFSQYPEKDEAFCRASLGYLLGAVERLSGAPATVCERSCQCRGDSACRYFIGWTDAAARGPLSKP